MEGAGPGRLVPIIAVVLLTASFSRSGQRTPEPAANGLRARVSVAEIKDQTARGGVSTHWMERFRITWREIGEGMREMLVTALFRSKRFVLLERELLPEILKEQDRAGTGRAEPGTSPAAGAIIGTDLIVTGAVTEFIADAFGAKGAADAWGTQVDASVNKGYVGLSIRVIDAKTSQVVVATYVMGKASNYGFEAQPGPEAKLPVSLAVFARTPAERAIRSAIKKAAEDIVGMVPKTYFKY
jgi:curli biogenesis system outer membrane secretion channel CsgG